MVKNVEKWGRDTAAERYGGRKNNPSGDGMGAPQGECYPQCPEDKQGPGYANDVASNWLRGMGKGEAEGKPAFDKTGRNPKGIR